MLEHVTSALLLAAHRAMVVFRVQTLVMNIMLGTVFGRLRAERATFATARAPVTRRNAFAVNAAVATLYADIQLA